MRWSLCPLGFGAPRTRGPSKLLEVAAFDPAEPSFSISLDDAYDWVLFLVDSDNPDKEMRVISYITVGVDEDTVLAMPVSGADELIVLGTLEANGDEATSNQPLSDAAEVFNPIGRGCYGAGQVGRRVQDVRQWCPKLR